MHVRYWKKPRCGRRVRSIEKCNGANALNARDLHSNANKLRNERFLPENVEAKRGGKKIKENK